MILIVSLYSVSSKRIFKSLDHTNFQNQSCLMRNLVIPKIALFAKKLVNCSVLVIFAFADFFQLTIEMRSGGCRFLYRMLLVSYSPSYSLPSLNPSRRLRRSSMVLKITDLSWEERREATEQKKCSIWRHLCS